ncbi:uncharacterized protein LOC143174680 [Nomia melanderi]|uniref:uncharacterized protein LOC143174680 n=1 Tax=Nomia melanderi TaxID=2448451 RepID=UPI003FCE3C6F
MKKLLRTRYFLFNEKELCSLQELVLKKFVFKFVRGLVTRSRRLQLGLHKKEIDEKGVWKRNSLIGYSQETKNRKVFVLFNWICKARVGVAETDFVQYNMRRDICEFAGVSQYAVWSAQIASRLLPVYSGRLRRTIMFEVRPKKRKCT